MVPPKGGLPGVPEGSLLKPLKSVYEFADAPREWWIKFRDGMLGCGWEESKLKKALVILKDRRGKVVGLAAPHVDDCLFTGHGDHYERTPARVRKVFTWGKWAVDDSELCGRRLTRPANGDVHLD